MTGYQQAIIMLHGQDVGGRRLVRSVDPWYISVVAPLWPNSRPYLQQRDKEHKQAEWVIKGVSGPTQIPTLSDVEDWLGFCRGLLELRGVVDGKRWKNDKQSPSLRLRIYGQPAVLVAFAEHIPAAPKKMQTIQTANGGTYSFNYQSTAEVSDILDYLYGEPCNQPLWDKWDETRQQIIAARANAGRKKRRKGNQK